LKLKDSTWKPKLSVPAERREECVKLLEDRLGAGAAKA
jgi:hypothetical protein